MIGTDVALRGPMSATRTAWHPIFTDLLIERAPPWIEVRAEVPLSAEPLRVDDLLLLRAGAAHDPASVGSGLRGLWRRVRVVALLEFKSRARAFRRGDLHRLLAYGALWCAQHDVAPSDVTLILMVPRVGDGLLREIGAAGLTLDEADDGYHEVRGSHLRVVVAELRRIAADEGDELLRWFVEPFEPSLATRRWLRQHLQHGSEAMRTDVTPDLEGYEEMVREIIETFTPEERLAGLTPEQRLAGLAPEQRLAGLAPEQRLAGLPPEQRLAGLAPEQRLAGLSRDEALLALPDDVLRTLPAAYIDGLPTALRDAIRARVGRAS